MPTTPDTRRSRATAALGTTFRLDLSDDAAMARLRGRVLGGLNVCSALTMTGGTALDPTTRHSGTTLLAVPWMLLVGILLIRFGGRLGDRAFVAAAVTIVATSMLWVPNLVVPGSLNPLEYTPLSEAIICAVFCGRRRHLAVGLSATLSLVTFLAYRRVGGSAELPGTVLGEVFTFTTVVLVVRLLRDLARHAVLEAKRGEVTDPLTGLANRRGLERRGSQYWASAAQSRARVAVLMVDIDFFKSINDTHGHGVGDETLRQVADVLRRNLRDEDVIVRLGGEEFAVLASIPPGDGELVAERLRNAVERDCAPVTVSIGLHETAPAVIGDLQESLWDAVGVADLAMYEAKRSGRNRVVRATAPAGPAT